MYLAGHTLIESQNLGIRSVAGCIGRPAKDGREIEHQTAAGTPHANSGKFKGNSGRRLINQPKFLRSSHFTVTNDPALNSHTSVKRAAPSFRHCSEAGLSARHCAQAIEFETNEPLIEVR